MAPEPVGVSHAVIDLTELSDDEDNMRKVFPSSRSVVGPYAASTAAAPRGHVNNSAKKPNPNASLVSLQRNKQGIPASSFGGRLADISPRGISQEHGAGLGPGLGQQVLQKGKAPASASGFVAANNARGEMTPDQGNTHRSGPLGRSTLVSHNNSHCVRDPSSQGPSPGLLSPGLHREKEKADEAMSQPMVTEAMSQPMVTESMSPAIGNWGEALPAENPLLLVDEQDADDYESEVAQKGTANGAGNWAENAVTNESRRIPSPIVNVSSSPDPGVCRLFWRAGDYEAQRPVGVQTVHGAMDHVRVHPKFLHSNATSHKWALGAVAELLDNAVDEIQNGATFVNVDKIVNPRDGSPALLIQDDGGGMSPDCMRQCMSLGYSRKNTNSTIGQYGNGFKTSTMRLGADVIVFSRNVQDSRVTQSVGLLSYTFLRKTGHEDVVVPMVDYEVSRREGDPPKKVLRTNLEDWSKNLNTIMQWSPYVSEALLLRQFEDVGWHGTKVIVYNLWFNDDGVLELDFDTDEQDIQLRGGGSSLKGKQMPLVERHIANRYHHSLRVYASILYLRVPEGFSLILRGKPVAHHNIASDLKFPEQIVYKPQIGNTRESNKEISVMTVIGFTKEAPLVNVHGFNVYHKNRLIMPFWKVWQDNSSRGRGVVGVLEANFVEPAHDKQDFERTAVLLRLETRLKQMTVEYWNLHCHLIGYQPNTKAGKARKLATPSLEYPSPIASILPPDVPPGSANFDPSETSRFEGAYPGQTGFPSASGPCTPPQHGADGVKPASGGFIAGRSMMKSEPATEGQQSQKRPAADFDSGPSTFDSVLESAQNFRRKRTAVTPQGAGATLRNADGTSTTLKNGDGAVVTTDTLKKGDGTLVVVESENGAILEVARENTRLRTKCTEYEVDMKKLESKVVALESELANVKMKCVNLQDELERVNRQQRPLEHVPSVGHPLQQEFTHGLVKLENSDMLH